MNRTRSISFPVGCWFVFLLILVFISWSDGKKRLAKYRFTEAVVVDKLFLPSPIGSRRYTGRRRDVEYAQWQYVVNYDTLLFVDKKYLTYNKPVGTKRKIIYLEEKPNAALVYSFLFWINTPLILTSLVIAVFIFGICQFGIHWNDKSWFQRQYKTLYK